MKKIISMGLAVALLTSITFVGAPVAKGAKKVKVSNSKISLTKGQSKKVAIKNKKKNAKYLFQTSAKKIATVSKTGLIKAKKVGFAKITVKEKYKKKTKKIGVVKVTVKNKKIVATASPMPTSNITSSPAPTASTAPQVSTQPSSEPSAQPSAQPSTQPTLQPSATPFNHTTPANFNKKNDGVAYGTMEQISYDSTTTGKTRKANVILPADYNADKEYPVLYLLHGIGGNQNEWLSGNPNEIVSNLVAAGTAKEMILVLPNVRCRANDAACYELTVEHFQAFDNFINDLRDNLMPYINEHYSIAQGRENTAIAGLSMGGRESLYIGLSMPETFGYVGAFCPAVGVFAYSNGGISEDGLFTESEFTLPDQYKGNTEIMIVKGEQDGTVGENPVLYHNALVNNGVEHIYYTMPGGHDFNVWQDGLYNFVRTIF